VEFAIDGVRQSQVNPAIGLGFAELLRGVLRQTPDVVMLGEIRDAETAQTAVQAANSGMLVLATLHAPAPTTAVQCLLGLGVSPQFLASCLRCVIGQRLVRTLCPQCKSSFELADAAIAFDEVRPWLKEGEGKKLYAATGCESCRGIGYDGLIGVFEVLPVSHQMRNLIAEGRPSCELRAQAIKENMVQFRQAAMLKVARGITTTEDIFRVIPAEHLLMEE
jgi:type II secretory ATPase GspE/PulE/Tfp pilus assembly ATPase PilB-like protein